jgi:uncharacterized metal-binding protein
LSELYIIDLFENKKIKTKIMKTTQASHDTGSHTFLTGTILFANLDYTGLAAYGIKAAIGGAIWMAFKLAGDYLSARIQTKKRKQQQDDQAENKED